jgi:hypothetical protein
MHVLHNSRWRDLGLDRHQKDLGLTPNGFMRYARKSYHASDTGKQIQVHQPTVDPGCIGKRKALRLILKLIWTMIIHLQREPGKLGMETLPMLIYLAMLV